jgi:copper chaperone CopZ
MMTICMLIAALLSVQEAEETYTVRITFEGMHCEECRKGTGSGLKAVPGVKSVSLDDSAGSATLQVSEEFGTRLSLLRKAVPSDVKISSFDVVLRGTVHVKDDVATFRSRISRQKVHLRNHEVEGEKTVDHVGELKKQVAGGTSRFRISGFVKENKKGAFLSITSFQQTDWKD